MRILDPAMNIAIHNTSFEVSWKHRLNITVTLTVIT